MAAELNDIADVEAWTLEGSNHDSEIRDGWRLYYG